MLQRIRSSAQSFGAKVIALLICFVLVVFGFGAFSFFNLTQPAAAVVAGDKITMAELEAEMEDRWRNALTELGPDIEPSRIGSVQYWLSQMIDHRLLTQRAKRLGMQSSRMKYLTTVSEMFRTPIEDLSMENVASVLYQMGFTVQGFENSIRDQELVDQVWASVWETAFTTEREILDFARVGRQRRDVAFLLFTTDLYEEEVEFSYDEVLQYYNSHKTDYLTEESFDLSFVVLDKARYIEDHEVTDEDIQAFFQDEVAQQEANAERKARHILLRVDEDRSEAQAIAEIQDFKQRIEDGTSFADLAIEHSEDQGTAIFGGDLGFGGRGLYVQEFEEALFNLEIGGVSEPVVTQFGVHLIELLEIQEVEPLLLEDRYESIRQELLEELATPAYERDVDLLGELAFEHVDSLDYLAEVLGLTVEFVPGVTRESGLGVFEQEIVRDRVLVDDVIVNGFNSETVAVDEQLTIVARMVANTPSSIRPLEEVRDLVRAKIREEKASVIALENRDAAFASIQESGDYSGIDEEYGIEWVVLDKMTRSDTRAPLDVRTKSFGAQLGTEGREIFIANGNGNDKAIVVVSAVYEGQFNELVTIDQESIRNNSNFDQRDLDIRGMMEAVRQRGKVRNKLTDEAVWRPGTGVELKPSG